MESLPIKTNNENINQEKHAFSSFSELEKEIEQIVIQAENRNKNGKLLAPNGTESKLQNELYWKIVRTPAFMKWFGDWQKDSQNASKVVDKKTGEPLVVYHATTGNIGLEGLQPQDLPEGKKLGNLHAQQIVYFSSDPKISNYFAERKEGEVKFYSCFLDIRNPRVFSGMSKFIDFLRGEGRKSGFSENHLSDLLKDTSDGVIQKKGEISFSADVEVPKSKFLNNSEESYKFELEGDQYAVFSADQIFHLPNENSLGKNTSLEKELDQIELPYSFLTGNYLFSYRLVLDRSINKEVFDFKIGLCDFLLKKIDLYLKDKKFQEKIYQDRLNRRKKSLMSHKNHFIAWKAFINKDKAKLNECISNSDWRTEKLQVLFDNLK